jgi:multidrug resistance efflux pump
MIRKLKSRPRADTQQNQPRSSSRSTGRRIYLLLLVLFGLALSNYVWGDRVMMRADGLLLRDRTMVAATSVVRIEDINVRPGQRVAKGDVLFTVGSLEIVEKLTDFSLRNAQIKERFSALEARRRLLDDLVPLAEDKLRRAHQALKHQQQLAQLRLVPGQRSNPAQEMIETAQENLQRLNAERDNLDIELASLEPIRDNASDALQKLEDHYANGAVRAASDGFIGDVTPSVGEVFLAGEPILSVITGAPYVLAYLPDTYVFRVNQGLPVEVQNGQDNATGVISEILPVSQTLPKEFQNAFRPNRTRQLARIDFAQSVDIPTFANVRISRPLSGDAKSISNAISHYAQALTTKVDRIGFQRQLTSVD